MDQSKPSQFNVNKNIFENDRIAAIRGKILDQEGNTLSKVKVSILNNNGFGYTTTVSDGSFSIVVNGRATYVVNLYLPGYLPAQRTIEVPVNAWTWLDDVILVKKDPSQKINIGEASLTSNSEKSDSDGIRSIDLLATSNLSAYLVKEDGTRTALDSISISATEYTVGDDGPKSMPASLPTASGYTYAVEIDADESAQGEIELGSPIYTYVSNFLGFPIGSPVPVGSYDSKQGVWIPEKNGKVVGVMGKSSSGLALIDLNGDGRPETEEAMQTAGIGNEERKLLAEKYGDQSVSLWRVPITSFGTKDFNWPYSLPEGAIKPDDTMYGGDIEEQNPCYQPGSIIDCHNQTFTESIALDRTPFSLVYSSKLARSRSESSLLRIPLLRQEVHPRMKLINLSISIAGQNFNYNYQPEANLVHTFMWDGKDAWQRSFSKPQAATVTISYEYYADYVVPKSTLERAFGKIPEGNQATLEMIPGRDNLTKKLVTKRKVWLGSYSEPRKRFGGWMINIDSMLDPETSTIIDGNGGLEDVGGHVSLISEDSSQVEAPLYEAFQGRELKGPKSVVPASNGDLLLADTHGHQILKQGKDGTIEVIAGTGDKGFGGDGGQAVEAIFNTIEAIAINPIDKSIILADLGNRRVRTVSSEGIVETIAGSGTKSCMQNTVFPIPALEASFDTIRGVNVSSDGIIYIADSPCNRVYQLTSDGFISPFAGSGVQGFEGDGESASSAKLSGPDSIAVDINGYIYISETGNHIIRVVRTDGKIFRVAGTGSSGNSGDGQSATLATFKSSNGMAFDQKGNLYIADITNNNIRYIDKSGIIRTYLGKSGSGEVIGRSLSYPHGIGFDGTVLYIAEKNSKRVTAKKLKQKPGSKKIHAVSTQDALAIRHYNSEGKLLKVIDATLGITLYDFSYDNEGRLSSITDIDGVTYELFYSGNQVEKITTPYNQETRFNYYGSGLLKGVTDSQLRLIELDYKAESDLLQSLTLTDVNLKKSFEYDDFGNLVKDTNFNGSYKRIDKEYLSNESGYSVTLTKPSGGATIYQVFSDKRITTYPDGSKSKTYFNSENKTHVSESSDGVKTTLTVNELDKISSIVKTDAEARTSSIEIDQDIRFVNGIRAKGIESYTINVKSNAGSSSKTHFDRSSKTLTVSTSDGSNLEITFNDQGRIAQKKDLNGELLPVIYRYYPDGLLQKISQGDRVQTFQYNERGDIDLKTYPDQTTVSYLYDYPNNTYTTIYQNGLKVKKSLDKVDRLKKLDIGSSTHFFSYLPATGELENWSLPKLIFLGDRNNTNSIS